MDRTPTPLTAVIDRWPSEAAAHAHAVRSLWQAEADALGIAHLDESLKWGEPAWRPRKGGATLRLSWKASVAELGIFVDCKTDLCARMQSDYPEAFRYVPPRALFLHPGAPLPVEALAHLARIAFRYKRVIPTG